MTGRAALEASLLETGRSLLIPSLATAAPLVGGTIAIAWKPTPQAVRAVAASMPFITRAKNVVVMTVEEERAPEKADRLVRSLAWHGCQAAAVLLRNNGHAVETLFPAAKQSADLLVMGGYGHVGLYFGHRPPATHGSQLINYLFDRQSIEIFS